MAEVNSPEWWADRLSKRIHKRRPELDRLERYYAGRTPLSYATSRFREEFGTMLAAINDNWTQLVVSAVEERLNVEGFRIGNDPTADDEAWDIWQENRLDEDSQVAHTEALKLSEAHLIVWKQDDVQGPVITVEHPSQVCVELDPANRSKRLAAAKTWRDETVGNCCTVYLPDGIYKFRRGKSGWERRTVTGEPWPVPNQWGVVPVVPLQNRPGLSVESVSEIENVLSKQDMINKLLADMIVAAEYSAFRQRWATGVDIPTDPGTAEASEDFIAAVNRLWHVPAPDAKFGEFDQTDLGVYVKAIEMLVQHIASQTATPPHYLLNTGVLPSGESLRAAEAPLVAKARRKQRVFGGAWEEVIRLALLMKGRNVEEQISTVWADPESRTESEHVDAVMKMKALDVPVQQLWEQLGFTPQQIDRFKQMRMDDALNQMLANPAAASTASPMPSAGGMTPDEIRSAADAMGVLIRAGVSAESAAERVGLAGLVFTGAVPESGAAVLEG